MTASPKDAFFEITEDERTKIRQVLRCDVPDALWGDLANALEEFHFARFFENRFMEGASELRAHLDYVAEKVLQAESWDEVLDGQPSSVFSLLRAQGIPDDLANEEDRKLAHRIALICARRVRRSGRNPLRAQRQFIGALADFFERVTKWRATVQWNEHKGGFDGPFYRFVLMIFRIYGGRIPPIEGRTKPLPATSPAGLIEDIRAVALARRPRSHK